MHEVLASRQPSLDDLLTHAVQICGAYFPLTIPPHHRGCPAHALAGHCVRAWICAAVALARHGCCLVACSHCGPSGCARVSSIYGGAPNAPRLCLSPLDSTRHCHLGLLARSAVWCLACPRHCSSRLVVVLRRQSWVCRATCLASQPRWQTRVDDVQDLSHARRCCLALLPRPMLVWCAVAVSEHARSSGGWMADVAACECLPPRSVWPRQPLGVHVVLALRSPPYGGANQPVSLPNRQLSGPAISM